jgi:hypothetical protein
MLVWRKRPYPPNKLPLCKSAAQKTKNNQAYSYHPPNNGGPDGSIFAVLVPPNERVRFDGSSQNQKVIFCLLIQNAQRWLGDDDITPQQAYDYLATV